MGMGCMSAPAASVWAWAVWTYLQGSYPRNIAASARNGPVPGRWRQQRAGTDPLLAHTAKCTEFYMSYMLWKDQNETNVIQFNLMFIFHLVYMYSQ